MIMAAGLGTRLAPFTAKFAKAALPVFGVPMSQFAVDMSQTVKVKNLVANVHAHAEAFSKSLKALDFGGASLAISDESKLLLGSAGGVRNALNFLGPEATLLLNADTLSNLDIEALLETHHRLNQQHGVVLTLAVFPKSPPPGKYRELIMDPQSGLITGFVNEPKVEVPFFVGTAVFERGAYDFLSPDVPHEFVPEVLTPLIEKKQVGFFRTQGIWLDIGSPELWYKAHIELMTLIEKSEIPAQWQKRITKQKIHRVSRNLFIGPFSTLQEAEKMAEKKKLSENRIRGFYSLRPELWEAYSVERFKAINGSVVYDSAPSASFSGISIAHQDLWVTFPKAPASFFQE